MHNTSLSCLFWLLYSGMSFQPLFKFFLLSQAVDFWREAAVVCRIPVRWVHLMFLPDGIRVTYLWQGPRSDVLLFSLHHEVHNVSLFQCCGVNNENLFKMVAANLLQCELTTFSSESWNYLWVDTLILCKYPQFLETFTQCFRLHPNSVISVISWITAVFFLCYLSIYSFYHGLLDFYSVGCSSLLTFWCLYWPWFSPWEHSQTRSSFCLICLHHYLRGVIWGVT